MLAHPLQLRHGGSWGEDVLSHKGSCHKTHMGPTELFLIFSLKNGAASQMLSREDHLPHCMVALFLMQDNVALALLAVKGMLCSTSCPPGPHILFCKAALQLHGPQHHWLLRGGVSPQVSGELPEVPDSPFLRFSGWKHNPLVYQPLLPVFVSSADLHPYLKVFRPSCCGLYRAWQTKASVLTGASRNNNIFVRQKQR